jgi:hypothetical protein
VKDITQADYQTVDNYKMSFLNLMRDSKNELAGTILLIKYTQWGSPVSKTYCIPYRNPELEKKWTSDLSTMDLAMLRAAVKSMSMHLPSR